MSKNCIERCKALSVAKLVDAMNGFGAVNTAIRPLDDSFEVCGFAETVWSVPGNEKWLDTLLAGLQKDAVVVVDAGGEGNIAAVSADMIKKIQDAGAAGIVVDGVITQYLQQCKPIFARDVHPKMLGPMDAYRVNQAVCLGGVPVNQGDLVYGNGDGLVVIPARDIEQVLAKAEML